MINKLTCTLGQLEVLYALATRANAYGNPHTAPLSTPLACALRSVPVPLDPNESFADGIHTEALMGCIMGAMREITGSFSSNDWLSTPMLYRFIGMCTAEGDTPDFQPYMDYVDILQLGGQHETMQSFSFEPTYWLYAVDDNRMFVFCQLWSEGYNCDMLFELSRVC